MRTELRLTVHQPDAAGDWHITRLGPYEVTTEPDIIFCGGQMLPGLMFDNYVVEQQLEPYLGENSLGEAIFASANDCNERHGCYFYDRRETLTDHALVAEWEIIKVLYAADLPTA